MSEQAAVSPVEDAWLAEWTRGYAEGWAEAVAALTSGLAEAVDGVVADLSMPGAPWEFRP